MPDYSRYLVDPWKGARQAEAMNYRNNALAYRKSQDAITNDIAQKNFGLRERAQNYNMMRNKKLDSMSYEEKKRRVMEWQMGTIAKGLDSVVDEQSHLNFVNWLGGLVKSGMVDPKFMKQIPQSYDKEAVERGKEFFKEWLPKIKSGSLTSSLQEYRQAVAEGWDKGYAKWVEYKANLNRKPEKPDKPESTQKYAKELNDIYQDLTKGGFKQGDKIPDETLEIINYNREKLGWPKLTEKQGKVGVPFNLIKPWTWDREGSGTVYEPEGTQQTEKEKPRPSDPDSIIDHYLDLAGPKAANADTIVPEKTDDLVLRTPKREPAQIMGELRSGIQFGRGEKGYVVIESGEERMPTESELKEIQTMMMRNAQMGSGGTAIPMPKYTGPKGGWSGIDIGRR